MSLFDRKFGVELEVITSRSMIEIASLITAAGIECVNAGYTHRTIATWKVVPDGSIRGIGCEVVSPPLFGEEGLEQVRQVCRVLKDAGCTINSSCGLHVHVDARQLGVPAIRKLTISYIDFEGVIDSLLPPTRRGNRNLYCQSITGASKTAIAAATDMIRISSQISSRYVKLNIESFWRHGTIEFRHHSGTVDATKAANWVKFCLRMVDAAASNSVIEVVSTPAVARPIVSSEASRRAIFIRLLLRPEGATRDEIFNATGWRRGSLSMRRFASEAGLELRSRRSFGRVRRYYATLRGAQVQAVAVPSQPATLQGLASLLGMAQDEVEYWTSRQQLFAQERAA